MKKVELLAPVGSFSKLHTALHFGADAVYFGGKEFSLRAFANNFSNDEIKEALDLIHSQGKKGYITLNIFAKDSDFAKAKEFVKLINSYGADGFIVSDTGLINMIRREVPDAEIHLSTQANTLNSETVKFWRDFGVKRIVLARECTLDEIKKIKDEVQDTVELEVFIHGAMCISYSGRCLLSTYLTDRDSNRGECVQACRWEYSLGEVSRKESLTIQEDKRGTYILNSKDMNTMDILDKIIEAGANSLKIEGRMKSEYYVGTVVNAYRKRIDQIIAGKEYDKSLYEELEKVNHREYTTGFYLGKPEQYYESSVSTNIYKFVAEVVGYNEEKGLLEVIQRNRFFDGDVLECVSNTDVKEIKLNGIFDEKMNKVEDCKLVQQRLFLKTNTKLNKYDMIRKKV